jgi:hypothetical protein
MAKTKEQKQREALERARAAKWENSRAKRLGTKTREQWEEMNKALCQ